MRKELILITILILALAGAAYAGMTYAPHDVTNNMGCTECHKYGSIPLTDAPCLECHINETGSSYTKINAPKVRTHSSANTSATYGTWSYLCLNCHQVHLQQQVERYGSQTFLVTGMITSITDNGNGTTTFGYSSATAGSPAWAGYERWGKKTGRDRGLLLYPNTANIYAAFEIISAAPNQIIAQGSINAYRAANPIISAAEPALAPGNTFGLAYGQLIRRSLNGTTVRFFDQTGSKSFAHNDGLVVAGGNDSTRDGICQVCHTSTKYWRRDGTLTNHYNGENCTVCHSHVEGFKASCEACHGFPPVNNTLGGPNGLVNLPAPTGSTTAGSHNRHTLLGMDCTDCHYNSKGSGPTHNDRTVQAITLGFYNFGGARQGGAYDGQTAADYDTTVTNPVTTVTNTLGTKQCSNIYCHSTGQGAGGTALTASDYKTPVWGGTAQCGTCHLGDGSQGSSLMMSGSHGPHANAFIRLGCSECHNGAGPGTTRHVNNNIEMVFRADPFGNTGSYSQSPNTPGNGYGNCSNIYCHSVVQREGGTALVSGSSDYKSATWGVSGTAQCGNCHAYTNMSTGSHRLHIITASIGCSSCHDTAGALTSKHADYIIDVKFNSLLGTTASYSQSINTPGNGYGTCSSLNCHSDGKAAPSYATVTWGGAGTALCMGCHGGAGGSTGAANTSLTSAHTVHTGSGAGQFSYTCSACHSTVAGSNTTIIDKALHNNGIRNVSITAGFGSGSSYSSESCSATYCHGTKSVAWTSTTGVKGDCSLCHGMSNSITDGRDTNGDTAATDPQVGAHVVHLNASNSYSNPIVCSECHIVPAGANYAARVSAAGHIDSALPAEVPMNGTLVRREGAVPVYSTGTCSNMYCHGSTMGSNQGTATSPVWNNTGYLTGTPTLAGDCSKCHLSPPVTAPHTSDMTLAQCAPCHDHFEASGALNNKALHVDGIVQASGCDACHGNPPVNNTLGGPNGLASNDGGTGSGSSGAHARHAAAVSAGGLNYSCETCHTNGMPATPVYDKIIQIGFNSFSLTTGNYDGRTAPLANGYTYSANVTRGGTQTCSNLYCHGNYSGSGLNAAPIWSNAASGACGTCHGASNTATPNSGNHAKHSVTSYYQYQCTLCHRDVLGGTSPASYTIADKSKHVNRYVDWSFDPADGRTSGGTYSIASGTVAPSDGNTTAGRRGYGTCSNVYCHSNVQPDGGVGAPTVYATPKWGTTIGCNTCHAGGHGNPITTGSHSVHLAYSFTTSDIYKCVICHSWNQAQSLSCTSCHFSPVFAKHSNYQVEIVFDSAFNSSASYNQAFTPGNGYSNCNNTYCHSAGTSVSSGTIPNNTTTNWGSGTLTCNSCHTGGTASGPTYSTGTPKANSHNKHVVDNSYRCAECHSETVDGTNTIISTSKHVNKKYDVSGARITSYTFAADGGTCATACHGTKSVSWTPTTAVTGNCSLCHGMSNDTNDGRDTNGDTAATDPQVGAHVVHLNASNNYSSPIACSECHTVPAGATYADRVKAAGHIDSALPAEVPMNGTLVRKNGALPVYTAGTCSNMYCHGGRMADSNKGTGTAPLWTDTAYLSGTPSLAATGDCNKCHKAPPATPPHSPTMTLAQCAQCHSHFNANGTLNNNALHIDGTVQASGGCNACHGYPPAPGDAFPYRGVEGKGAHVKHINDIIAAKGVTLNPDTDTYGAGAAGIVCGTCHSNLTSNHMNNTRSINFGDGSNEYMFGLNAPRYNGEIGTSSTVTMKSCSNISCHYGTTPGWQNPATAGQ